MIETETQFNVFTFVTGASHQSHVRRRPQPSAISSVCARACQATSAPYFKYNNPFYFLWNSGASVMMRAHVISVLSTREWLLQQVRQL